MIFVRLQPDPAEQALRAPIDDDDDKCAIDHVAHLSCNAAREAGKTQQIRKCSEYRGSHNRSEIRAHAAEDHYAENKKRLAGAETGWVDVGRIVRVEHARDAGEKCRDDESCGLKARRAFADCQGSDLVLSDRLK